MCDQILTQLAAEALNGRGGRMLAFGRAREPITRIGAVIARRFKGLLARLAVSTGNKRTERKNDKIQSPKKEEKEEEKRKKKRKKVRKKY
jgi:hypothetical protein